MSEPKPENAERKCREGHTYVTDATSPGKCWCGASAALEAVPDALPQEVIDGLSPGVRELVVWLNAEGFRTVDSGDGSNHVNGMGCAVPFPMVAILSRPEGLVDDARRLKERLLAEGLKFAAYGRHSEDPDVEVSEWPQIQATYDPVDDSAVIVLYNVLSADVGL